MAPTTIRRSAISTEVPNPYRDLFDSEDQTTPPGESYSLLPESHCGDRFAHVGRDPPRFVFGEQLSRRARKADAERIARGALYYRSFNFLE
jgi:hypothetical protein